MTREEFVRNGSWILKVIRDRCELTQAETDYLNYLIEVLEQEPCEDCISRKQALEEIDRTVFCYTHQARQIIEDLPPVTPKTKTGHWQNNACSNCGIYNASAYKNWCPNCGCQMTEDTE